MNGVDDPAADLPQEKRNEEAVRRIGWTGNSSYSKSIKLFVSTNEDAFQGIKFPFYSSLLRPSVFPSN